MLAHLKSHKVIVLKMQMMHKKDQNFTRPPFVTNFASGSEHSSYCSIKWYGGRGGFDIPGKLMPAECRLPVERTFFVSNNWGG